MKYRKIYSEPTVTERKWRLKSTVWTTRKKEASNQNRIKKQEFKKMRRDTLVSLQNTQIFCLLQKMRTDLGTSRTSFNVPRSES